MNSSDPFSKFENKLSSRESEPAEDPFKKFSSKQKSEKKEPSKVNESLRIAAGMGSDAANVILGIPGDLRDFVGSIFDFGKSYLPEGAQQTIDKGVEAFNTTAGGKIINAFPTSGQLERKASERSGGYLDPQGDVEKSVRELEKDIVAFASPGTGKFKWFKNLGIPILGNGAKELSKEYLDLNDQNQALVKFGVMGPLSFINPSGARKHAQQYLMKAEEALPQNARMDSQPITEALKPLKSRIVAPTVQRKNKRIIQGTRPFGGSSEAKTRIHTKLDEINEAIRSGTMDVKEGIEFRRTINKMIDDAGGFDLTLGTSERDSYMRNLESLRDAINKGLKNYGSTVNPKFGEYNQMGTDAWRVLQQTNRMSNFIKRKAGKQISQATSGLLGLGTAGGSVLNPALAVPALTTSGIYQGAKTLERVMRSPVLAEYYLKTLQAASQGNAKELNKYLEKLDKGLIKEESKDQP